MNEHLCLHFRSKAMYVTGEPKKNEEAENESAAMAYCWCNLTMTEIGIDDRLVNVDACSSTERPCRRSR